MKPSLLLLGATAYYAYVVGVPGVTRYADIIDVVILVPLLLGMSSLRATGQ